MQKFEVSVVENVECEQILRNYSGQYEVIGDGNLCAMNRDGGKDACEVGDWLIRIYCLRKNRMFLHQ